MGSFSPLGSFLFVVVFIILFSDLTVGNFGGAFVEEPWASHSDVATPVDFNKLRNLSGALLTCLGYFAVVVGDGYRCL